MKSPKNEFPNSFNNFAELNRSVTNLPSDLQISEQNLRMIKNRNILIEMQRAKSPQSIFEMNKLNKTLSNLEDKCDIHIAQKYLNGFLEDKGADSLEEFLVRLK